MVNSVNNNNNNSSNNSSSNSNYTVKSGDTLSAIAKSQGVSVNSLMKANPQIQNANMIHAGQDIHIPGNGAKTGNLSGMPVSTSANPSERPARMSNAAQTDGIAAGAKTSLPSPYSKYQNEIMAASKKYNVPPEIITGVMSRETNGQNIIGDGGHGHGLMQIDDRSHGDFLRSHQNGLDPASNIDYGTSIIRDNLNRYNGDYRKALAAYNAGPGNVDRAVRNGLSPDAYTTGHNYSSDVLNRANGFKSAFNGAGGGGGDTTASTAAGRRAPAPSSSSASPTSPAASRTGGSGDTHTVVKGDTLWDIAQSRGVSLNSLIAANPQIKNPDLIFPGQQVNIPGGGSSGGAGSAARRSGGGGSPEMGGVSGAESAEGSRGGSSAAYNNARAVLGRNISDLKYNGPMAQYLDKWPGNNVCCANFVSAALEKAGQISHSQHNDSVRGLAANLSNDPQWSRVSLRDAKPGDVVAFNVPGEGPLSHVVMFAGFKNGQPTFIGSNNANADGTQRITETAMNYPINSIFHYHG